MLSYSLTNNSTLACYLGAVSAFITCVISPSLHFRKQHTVQPNWVQLNSSFSWAILHPLTSYCYAPSQPHLPRCQWSWATNADRFIYFLFIYLLLLDTLIPLRWKEINVFHLRISINETQKSELPKYFRRNKTVLWAGHVCPRQAGEGLAAGQGLICRGYIFYSLKKTRDQKTKTSAISLI